MNNGCLHDIMAEVLAKSLVDCGFDVRSDAAVPGGYADLLAVRVDTRLVVEIERSADRVVADARKAEACKAVLLIVCPTQRGVDAARRKLLRSGYTAQSKRSAPNLTAIYVLTPAASVDWVYAYFGDSVPAGWKTKSETNRTELNQNEKEAR